MATTKTKLEDAITTPTTWQGTTGAEVLAGVDLVDKSTLEGVPFLITGIRNHIGSEDRLYAQIEFTLGDPDDLESRQMFQDSGKGIRDQIDSVFLMREKVGLLEEWLDVRIVCPKGLRVSEHDQTDERGRPIKVRSHYLTTSGRRNR